MPVLFSFIIDTVIDFEIMPNKCSFCIVMAPHECRMGSHSLKQMLPVLCHDSFNLFTIFDSQYLNLLVGLLASGN